MLRRTTALVPALFLSACAGIPWPHRAVVTPEVSGTITAEDRSVAALPVKVCMSTRDACCVGAESLTQTSDSGKFHAAPKTELRVFMLVMAHKQFFWCLGALIDGAWQMAGPYSQYTLIDTGPAFPERLGCVASAAALSCEQLPRRADGT
jgi:hypothetical protein